MLKYAEPQTLFFLTLHCSILSLQLLILILILLHHCPHNRNVQRADKRFQVLSWIKDCFILLWLRCLEVWQCKPETLHFYCCLITCSGNPQESSNVSLQPEVMIIITTFFGKSWESPELKPAPLFICSSALVWVHKLCFFSWCSTLVRIKTICLGPRSIGLDVQLVANAWCRFCAVSLHVEFVIFSSHHGDLPGENSLPLA